MLFLKESCKYPLNTTFYESVFSACAQNSSQASYNDQGHD